jgi:hypothetical protein
LFGRQTDSNGSNTKVWVAFNLPYNKYFNCVGESRAYAIQQELNLDTKLFRNRNVYKTEINIITNFKALIKSAIECCTEERSDEECIKDIVVFSGNENLKVRLELLLNN